MHSMGGESAFQTHIVVKYYRGEYNHEGVNYFAYAVYDMDIPVKRMFKEYRKSFGIEYSYKLIRHMHGPDCYMLDYAFCW